MAPCSATATRPPGPPPRSDARRRAAARQALRRRRPRARAAVHAAGTGALTVDGRPLLVKGPSPCRRRTDAARGTNLLLLLDMVAAGRGDETAVQAATTGSPPPSCWPPPGRCRRGGRRLGPGLRGTNGLAFRRAVRGRGGGRAVRAAELPPRRRPAPRAARAAGRHRGDRRGEVAAALAARGHRVPTPRPSCRGRAGARWARCRPTARTGRAAVHQRHDLGAQGGRAAAPAPGVLRDRHRRVRRRRARRGRARERAAVPRGRPGQPAQQPLPRAAHRVPPAVRRRRVGRGGAARASPTPWWCPRCWPDLRRARGRRVRPPDAAGAVLRRGAHAGHRAAP